MDSTNVCTLLREVPVQWRRSKRVKTTFQNPVRAADKKLRARSVGRNLFFFPPFAWNLGKQKKKKKEKKKNLSSLRASPLSIASRLSNSARIFATESFLWLARVSKSPGGDFSRGKWISRESRAARWLGGGWIGGGRGKRGGKKGWRGSRFWKLFWKPSRRVFGRNLRFTIEIAIADTLETALCRGCFQWRSEPHRERLSSVKRS